MTATLAAAFAGFFVAMSLAGAISALLHRSRASAAYAGLIALAAANASSGLFDYAPMLRVALVALYAIGVVVFALTLLRTLRYDRAVSWMTAGVVLVTLPLFFVGGVAYLGGLALEAAFFGYAVGLRNRGIQMERDRFERLAYLDPLTGVSNRRTFDETLVRMWNVARRAKVPIAVAMVDIDHFKRLNDTRGHQVGDECLRRVAALCSSALRRAGDCFARYGGEEFAAILVNIDLDHAITLTEHMRKVVERDGGITISVGIASRVPSPNDDPLALIADADDALYRAKHEGRNCVRVAIPPVSPATVT